MDNLTEQYVQDNLKLRTALQELLTYAERQTCQHDDTHRAGIWTVCDTCGRKWADDEGGFIPYEEPKAFTKAREVLDENAIIV